MITGIHFLLTYSCTYECDHCFLFCSPWTRGTFTRDQLRRVFDEIARLPEIEEVYFEGGEPFLYYPLLLEGLRMAGGLGLRAGIVTNCYWATTASDAEVWLTPIHDIGIADLSVSDDAFHRELDAENCAANAAAAARSLGIPCDSICIQPPDSAPEATRGGKPVTGGRVLFKGRAAEKLTAGLPRRPRQELTTCPHEDLRDPGRVHADSFGNVHLCQGISMGNMWQTPLSELIRAWDAARHPVCGPLAAGGPDALAREHGLDLGDDFVDECHYCYTVRKALLSRFPEHLAPPSVYGLSASSSK